MNTRACMLLGITVGLAGLMGGCVTTAYQRADQTSDVVTDVATRLDRATAEVDAVLGAVDGVVAAKGGDLRPPFTTFSDEVSKTETVVTGAQSRAADMRAHVDEHIDGWTEETKTLSSEELKAASAARRDKARAAAERVTQNMEKVKTTCDPFIAGVKDLRIFLGADLTSRGVDAAAPAIKKAKTDAQELKKAIQMAQAALTMLRSELASPSLPPAPPAATPPAAITK